jgi:hypothetical protein
VGVEDEPAPLGRAAVEELGELVLVEAVDRQGMAVEQSQVRRSHVQAAVDAAERGVVATQRPLGPVGERAEREGEVLDGCTIEELAQHLPVPAAFLDEVAFLTSQGAQVRPGVTGDLVYFELPVVSYELTEAKVSAGPAALFVTPNDEQALAKGILELLDDPGRRDEMGRIGRRRIEERLSWEHSVPSLLEAYGRVT